MPPSIVRFPSEQASLPSSDIDVLFLSAFLQLDMLYTAMRSHPQYGLTEQSASQVADLMDGILDAWEEKRSALG